MTIKIPYPEAPDWPDPGEDALFSPCRGDYLVLDPLPPLPPPPPPRPPKGRQAQEAALRQHGFDPNKVKRPPLEGHDEFNQAGFLNPDSEPNLRNERR